VRLIWKPTNQGLNMTRKTKPDIFSEVKSAIAQDATRIARATAAQELPSGFFQSPKKAGSLPDVLFDAMELVAKHDKVLGSFIDQVRFIGRKGLGAAMATNCVNEIYFDPDMISASPFSNSVTLAAVIAHECWHIIRDDANWLSESHHVPRIANIAMDCVINRTVTGSAMGFTFEGLGTFDPIIDVEPDGSRPCYYVTRSSYQTSESIYEALADKEEEKEETFKTGTANGDLDMSAWQEAIDNAGGQKAARKIVQDMVEQAVAEASKGDPSLANEIAGGYGDGSNHSGFLRLARQKFRAIKKIKLNPLAAANVARVIASTTVRKRSILSPSAMSVVQGRIMPGRRPHKQFAPAMAFDTSGSITTDHLQAFVQAAHSWVQKHVGRNQRVPVCFCDTKIGATGDLKDFRADGSVPHMGGGTDFAPILKWFTELPTRPSHLFFFTDTQARPVNFPASCVVWVLPPGYSPQSMYEWARNRAKAQGEPIIEL
jgi:predicted metal-dependent peptidase